jgi:PleD family two-component response regulator
MKNILIISDNINNINHFRRFLSSEYKISATNTAENALNMLQTKSADLILFHAGGDYGGFFAFYKALRRNPATFILPLIAVTDMSFIHALEDKVTLQHAAVVGLDITKEGLLEIVKTILEGN